LVQAFLKQWWVESDFITAQTRVILEIVNIILFLINHAIYSVFRTLTNKNHNKTKKISKTDQPRMDNPEMDILTRATGIYSM
jgi:hypothetical protein